MGEKKLRVLYLFCGVPPRSDIHACLRRLSKKGGFTLEVKEVDIERSNDDDLNSEDLWQQLLGEVQSGLWDVIVLSPPCNTFSRARCQWQKHPGPRPVRSSCYPWGFPWLSDSNYKLVQQHNFFILQCIKTCQEAVRKHSYFLLEHPEDLGAVGDQIPASIWQLPEIQNLQIESKAVTWALYQCHFGAQSPKPTRFLSNLPGCRKLPFATWPKFTSTKRYLGPLPFHCTHKFHVKKLIGKSQKGGFQTSPSASYPPALCRYLATLIAGVLRKGGKECGTSSSSNIDQVDSTTPLSIDPGVLDVSKFSSVSDNIASCNIDADNIATDNRAADNTAASSYKGLDVQESVSGEGQTCNNDEVDLVGDSKSWGTPIDAEWDNEERFFVDGFGLCSPNRWTPSCRGLKLGFEARDLSEKLFERTKSWVIANVGDLKREAFKLALGQHEQSPFTEEQLQQLRASWAELLPAPDAALKKADGQPFFLNLLSQALRLLEDPDWEILTATPDGFELGVPVGYKEPLPRTPSVFPPKTKHRSLDESPFQEVATNYKSAADFAEKLEEKFREDEKKGMMFCSTMGVLKEMYPDQTILVAAMGAIEKPDGSVRPLHDGTHFVQVNNHIKFQDQLQYPGPHDAAALLRETCETRDSYFVLGADISAAHRLVKVRKSDWHLLCCKARSESATTWVNCVGTFGISSAAYWWTRLFGCVGRFITRLMLQTWLIQLVYVDDLQLVATGPEKYLHLWMVVAAYEALGTPFSYRKFSGGLQTEFVGYWLDFKGCRLGISAKRGRWLLEFIEEMSKSNRTVSMRRFGEFLGRLGFVARVLVWLKAHLAPLYSWASALDRSTVATAPKLVWLVLKFLSKQLDNSSFLYSALRPLKFPTEVFRTDAKCADHYVVLGGVELGSGRWFSLRLTKEETPFLFKSTGESQWASAPAELLATLAALVAFGFLNDESRRSQLEVSFVAGTDNKSNEALLLKASTTRWPLQLINMQLSAKLMKAGIKLLLRWRPRDENTLADELTNEQFHNVVNSKRVELQFAHLELDLLNELWKEREDFLDKDGWKYYHDSEFKQRDRTKSKWG